MITTVSFLSSDCKLEINTGTYGERTTVLMGSILAGMVNNNKTAKPRMKKHELAPSHNNDSDFMIFLYTYYNLENAFVSF